MEEEFTPIEPYKNPGHTTHRFTLKDPRKFNGEEVTFDSDFDSGNCKEVI